MSARKGQKRPRVSDESQEEDLHLSDDEGTYVDNIYIPPPIKRQNIQSSNTRLMITHITNHFFKSYAENVILGPFCKCFNAIIGPNGSGKSNVIDSMLFVFGYRATKLRCKKLSVLLHNSENYSNIQSCTVAVHFCEIIDRPGKDYEIVPGSQFVVARTANKDNSSFYEINGKKVQFKEVAKLLKHHGIDLDTNRFLILQGEVEEIALMKCKGESENETGMLEYLENVIGTDRYKKTLVQLNERVENLCDLRTEKLNRFKIVEGELQELKGPMEQAFEFLKSENKIAICKNFLYQKEIYDLEENGKEVEEEKAKMEEDRNALIAELNNIVQEKTEKENVLKREASKYEHLQQKKERFKEAFNTADKKDVQLQAEMTQTNTNRKKFKKQLEEEKKKFDKLQKVPEENEKLIEECEASKEKLTSKKEELEKEKTALLATVREQSKDLQAKKEKLETELGKLKKKVDETKTEFDLASTKLNIAQSNEVEEKQKMQNIRETIANNNTTIKQRTEEVTQLKKKIPLTEKSLSEAQKELNGVKVEEAQILNEIKSQQMNLEETRASMQSTKSQNRVLDVLMGQKREGKCPGLYGRLGDLGAIDLKYDVAISTACGPLDNLVVDTADTAEWCIEFLKKHNVGRATFIALDKQEHLRQHANTRIKTPENVHRLFDLIQVQDETVKTAFYFALRNTLVADNLDQATRIAYGAQRFRVVTLKGDIIEISGTMSGGGKTVSRGRMGQSVRTATVSPQEMQKMEENLEQKKEHVRALLQKRTSLENQIRALEPELNQMKFNFEKFRQDLQELKEQQPLLQQQLQKQESVAKSTKSNPEEVKKLTKIVEDKRTAYEKACATAEDLQQEVDKLTGAIREKTVGKMRPVEKKLEETTKLLNKTKEEITRLRVAITTSDRDIKKSADKIKNFEQKITECENKLRTMQEKRSEIEDEAKKLLQCIEEVAEQLSEGIDENQTLKNEVKALADQEKKLLLKKVDVDQKFKEIKAKVDDVKGSLHQLHAKLKQLKLHIVPDEPTELKEYTIEELQSTNSQVMNLELQAAQNFIKSTTPNLNVIKEYRAAETVYMERAKELEEVTQKRNEMKNLFDKVKNQRRDEFMEAYNIIRLKLKEMYQMITLGGDADFEILDPCDPFADGVQLNVRPPRKSWKVISNLSGGEKTLASLALVFALHYYKPSPLYVMDEIDAALDFKNVSIVANYIKERTKNTQFIIISLRENMFELCDNLIGIYKVFNCTRTITVDPHAFDDKNEKQQANGDQCVPNAETINQSEPGVSQISV